MISLAVRARLPGSWKQYIWIDYFSLTGFLKEPFKHEWQVRLPEVAFVYGADASRSP